jgi:hypothetical protein
MWWKVWVSMCERRMELSQQISSGRDYFKRAIQAQTEREREREQSRSHKSKKGLQLHLWRTASGLRGAGGANPCTWCVIYKAKFSIWRDMRAWAAAKVWGSEREQQPLLGSDTPIQPLSFKKIPAARRPLSSYIYRNSKGKTFLFFSLSLAICVRVFVPTHILPVGQ